MSIEHEAWPPRLLPSGQFATVEQDSIEEHRQAAAVVLSTPVGSLVDEPTFGRSEQAFRRGIDAEALHDALRSWEPRLQATITVDDLTGLDRAATIAIGGATG